MDYDDSRFIQPSGFLHTLPYVETHTLILTAFLFIVDVVFWMSYFLFCNYPETTSLFGFQAYPYYQLVVYSILAILHVLYFFQEYYYTMPILALVKIIQGSTAVYYACTLVDYSQAPLNRIVFIAIYCFATCILVLVQTYLVFSRVKIRIARYNIYRRRLLFIPPTAQEAFYGRYGDAHKNGEEPAQPENIVFRPEIVNEEGEGTDDEDISYDDSEDED